MRKYGFYKKKTCLGEKLPFWRRNLKENVDPCKSIGVSLDLSGGLKARSELKRRIIRLRQVDKLLKTGFILFTSIAVIYITAI